MSGHKARLKRYLPEIDEHCCRIPYFLASFQTVYANYIQVVSKDFSLNKKRYFNHQDGKDLLLKIMVTFHSK